MDRRSFFGMMVGGLATAAAVRSFPFRVFSFPKEIQLPPIPSAGGFRQRRTEIALHAASPRRVKEWIPKLPILITHRIPPFAAIH